MDNRQLIHNLNDVLAVELPEEEDLDAVRDKLAIYINQLIERNFDQLVNLLYRLDINEDKLRQLLRDNNSESAGMIIASLIIERQIEKLKSREQFRRNDINNEGDEKW